MENASGKAKRSMENLSYGGRASILVVDDDPAVSKLISSVLLKNDFEVHVVSDGQQALAHIENRIPDMVILDIKMPKMGGREVIVRVREWSEVPIIMVSAIFSEYEKIEFLDLGADDYICKPFDTDELLARVRAVLRRTRHVTNRTVTEPVVRAGGIEIDFNGRKVTREGLEVDLTATEFSLLWELALNAGKVLTYSYLLEQVWGPNYKDEKEYLHVFIGRLRRKLEPDHANPVYLVNIPAVGYEFKDPAGLQRTA